MPASSRPLDHGEQSGEQSRERPADGPPPRGREPARRRPTLSKGVVLEAAIDHVDRFGLAGLSMRKLGASLEVEGMALYRYVRSRDELLDAMVDRLMDRLYADPDVLLRPEDDWQQFLRRVAAGVRRLALEHPQIFPLVATRHRAASWIRPPLRSLRWIEGFLSALLDRGFSEEAAVYAYRAFGSFLVGHLLLEVSADGVDPLTAAVDPGARAPSAPAPSPDLGDFPTLTRLADRLAVADLGEEFEHSLGNLLERLQEARERLS